MNQIEPGVQYNYVYDEDEYMIQEEEWDRDLLLDPAWEKQQRKVRGPCRACVPVPAGVLHGHHQQSRLTRSPRGMMCGPRVPFRKESTPSNRQDTGHTCVHARV